jgi:hypothetical protein
VNTNKNKEEKVYLKEDNSWSRNNIRGKFHDGNKWWLHS